MGGTADCELGTDYSKSQGSKAQPTTGPCCKLSPFVIRDTKGGLTRTTVPAMSADGNTVEVTAAIQSDVEATDITYNFEAFPPCALYNGIPTPVGDLLGNHGGALPVAPFRQALSSSCPQGTILCKASIAESGKPDLNLAQDQCCGALSSSRPSMEECIPGLGCYAKADSIPEYGAPQKLEVHVVV